MDGLIILTLWCTHFVDLGGNGGIWGAVGVWVGRWRGGTGGWPRLPYNGLSVGDWAPSTCMAKERIVKWHCITFQKSQVTDNNHVSKRIKYMTIMTRYASGLRPFVIVVAGWVEHKGEGVVPWRNPCPGLCHSILLCPHSSEQYRVC